jgi:hypothetical protein
MTSKARNLANLLADGAVGTSEIADNAITNAKITAMAASKLTGRTPVANAPLGSVLQVQQTLKTNAQAFSNTTQDIMSVTITPSSASSRILLMWTINAAHNGHSNFIAFRNSTAVYIGDAAGSRTRASHEMHAVTNSDQQNCYSGVLLDSPNTTSAITYKITGRAFVSVNLHINQPLQNGNDRPENTRTASSITVMEIAA